MSDSLSSRIRAATAAIIGAGKLDEVAGFFAPDYVAHVTDQDMSAGHEGIRQFVGLYRRAFPDLVVEVDILMGAGKRVAWQRRLRGTHQAAFKGFPASGRVIVWRDMGVSCFRDDLVVEEWVITDLAERLLLSRKG